MRFPNTLSLSHLALVFMMLCGCNAASQLPREQEGLTGPITLEVVPDSTGSTSTATATLVITASEEVSNAVLVVRAPEGIQVEPQRQALRLARNQPMRVQVKLATEEAGAHRIHFDIEAQAKGYDTAGTSERRYFVVDNKNPARILTGQELQRERHQGAVERLQGALDKAAGSATLDTYLAGKLNKIDEVPPVEEKGPLAPPYLGLEPYDATGVVDNSADVIRDLDPITVTGRFFFVNRSGTLRPFVNATIDIRDDDTFWDEQLLTTITDWDGRFTGIVNNDDGWFQNGRDIYVRIRATNSRFRVQDDSDWTYAWATDVRGSLSDGTVVDYGSLMLVDYQEAAIIFQDLNQGWNFLTTAGGQDPGFVDLTYPGSGSFYSTSTEEIDIEDGDEVAVDIVLHEYGHATMHNAYGGYWPPNTGGSHTFDSILHRNMAFTEGWGTFIALSINSDGVYNSNGWSRNIEAFNHSSGHSNGDGGVNEGHVAAGLGDIRDTSSDGNCSGECDPSGVNNASMSKMWRDSFWGSDANDINDYWDSLCPELTSAERNDAVRSLAFNEIDLKSCVCTVELSLLGTEDGEEVVKTLREFRDLALSGHDFGEWVLKLYRDYTSQVSGYVQRDRELRRLAQALFRRAAQAHVLLKKGAGDEILLDSLHAEMGRRFLERLFELDRRGELRELQQLQHLIDDLEGRSVTEVVSRFETLNNKKN